MGVHCMTGWVSRGYIGCKRKECLGEQGGLVMCGKMRNYPVKRATSRRRGEEGVNKKTQEFRAPRPTLTPARSDTLRS